MIHERNDSLRVSMGPSIVFEQANGFSGKENEEGNGRQEVYKKNTVLATRLKGSS